MAKKDNTALWIGGAIVVAAAIVGVAVVVSKKAALPAPAPPGSPPGAPPSPPPSPSPSPPAAPPAPPPSMKTLNLVAGTTAAQIQSGDGLTLQVPTGMTFHSDLTLDGPLGIAAAGGLGTTVATYALGVIAPGSHTISGGFGDAVSTRTFTLNLTVTP